MSEVEAKLDGFVKICVTGDWGVGKSSLILQVCHTVVRASLAVTNNNHAIQTLHCAHTTVKAVELT